MKMDFLTEQLGAKIQDVDKARLVVGWMLQGGEKNAFMLGMVFQSAFLQSRENERKKALGEAISAADLKLVEDYEQVLKELGIEKDPVFHIDEMWNDAMEKEMIRAQEFG